MPIVSPFVLQIGDTVWDLMKVSRWEEPSPQVMPPVVRVHFIDMPNTYVEFDKGVFEIAMQGALDAL